ncbi:MAG: hypothetical protein OXF79_03365 [Chloroflexi bacterium]|nr:hypothetical protein [Chloroflexota bacterium]
MGKFSAKDIAIGRLLPFRELCVLATEGLRIDSLIGDKVLMRTLVQLDGDVLTFVSSPGKVARWDQTANEQHWEKVQRSLKKVSSQLNSIIYSVTWVASILSFGIIAFSTLRDASPESWDTCTWIFHVLINVILPLGIGSVAYVGFLRRQLAPVFLKALRFWIGWHSSLARKEEVIAAKRRA